MRWIWSLSYGLAVQTLLLLVGGASAEDTKDTTGRMLFARRCGGCHSLVSNKEGPKLSGVYGRKVAAVPDFAYSDSLRKLDFRWDETSLDHWLTDPAAIAPDTDMSFRLAKAEERKAVITYLKTLTAK